MRWVLILASAESLLFGLWAATSPQHCFECARVLSDTSLLLCQIIGIILIAQGIGLLIAASKPLRHWPLILICLFVKTAVPIGFAFSAFKEPLPISWVWIALFHDVIWWAPFCMILWATLQTKLGRPPTREEPYTIAEASERYILSNDQSLAEAGRDQTLVLVFMRHFGCAFTRRILNQLQNLNDDCQRHDAKLVLVHMLQDGEENKYIQSKDNVLRIADPYCELYRAFGLGKGGFWELLGPRVWLKGILALAHSFALFRTCGAGPLAGDGLQMPGAFVYRNGQILSARPAKSAGDLPDVEDLFQGQPA